MRITDLFKLFRRAPALPKRLYVVSCERSHPFQEPGYTTDPRHYGLSPFNTPVTDEEFERCYRDKVKAFIRREDAIAFTCSANLLNVACPVYDRVDGKWIYNDPETHRLAEDIN